VVGLAEAHDARAKLLRAFQSPRRWGLVGLRMILRQYWKIQRRLFQSPRRWGGVGLTGDSDADRSTDRRVSIRSEVGRGRAQIHPQEQGDETMNVSIPSEVGRGQARTSSTCRRPWNR